MASLRAKIVNRYIRTVMKPKRLDLMETEKLRNWVEGNVIPILPRGVTREEVLGAVSGEWVRPEGEAIATVLYLHGGGYIFGSPRTHRTLTYAIAKSAQANVFAAKYRLAPEHVCPAAIDDAVAAWDWLMAQGARAEATLIGGDSAGGGLALATLLTLKARGGPMPAGAILYSPWTDLTLSGETLAANADADAMFQRATIEGGAPKYAGALDPADPRLSPLFGDLAGLPPLLVFASRDEMLFSDSTRLVEKAKGAGVDVRFEPREGLVHVWPLFSFAMPEAKEAIAITADFIRARSKGAP